MSEDRSGKKRSAFREDQAADRAVVQDKPSYGYRVSADSGGSLQLLKYVLGATNAKGSPSTPREGGSLGDLSPSTPRNPGNSTWSKVPGMKKRNGRSPAPTARAQLRPLKVQATQPRRPSSFDQDQIRHPGRAETWRQIGTSEVSVWFEATKVRVGKPDVPAEVTFAGSGERLSAAASLREKAAARRQVSWRKLRQEYEGQRVVWEMLGLVRTAAMEQHIKEQTGAEAAPEKNVAGSIQAALKLSENNSTTPAAVEARVQALQRILDRDEPGMIFSLNKAMVEITKACMKGERVGEACRELAKHLETAALLPDFGADWKGDAPPRDDSGMEGGSSGEENTNEILDQAEAEALLERCDLGRSRLSYLARRCVSFALGRGAFLAFSYCPPFDGEQEEKDDCQSVNSHSPPPSEEKMRKDKEDVKQARKDLSSLHAGKKQKGSNANAQGQAAALVKVGAIQPNRAPEPPRVSMLDGTPSTPQAPSTPPRSLTPPSSVSRTRTPSPACTPSTMPSSPSGSIAWGGEDFPFQPPKSAMVMLSLSANLFGPSQKIA